jgi:hypothetical protein
MSYKDETFHRILQQLPRIYGVERSMECRFFV